MKKLVCFLFLSASLNIYALEPQEILFRQAEQQYKVGNFQAAYDLFIDLTEDFDITSYKGDAYIGAAMSLFQLARYNDAVTLLNRVGPRYRSGMYYPSLNFWFGICHYKLGNLEKAVDYILLYLQGQDQGYKGKGSLVLGLAYTDLGLWEDAVAVLKDAVLFDDDKAYAITLLSFTYFNLKDYQSLIALYEEHKELLAGSPYGPSAQMYTAEAYLQKGDSLQAYTMYGTLLTQRPELAAVAYPRVVLLSRQLGDEIDLENLVAEAEKTLGGSGKTLNYLWEELAVSYFRDQKIELAELYFRRLWNSGVKDAAGARIALYLSQILISSDRAADAEKVLVSFIENNSYRDWQLYEALGIVYSRLADWENARSFAEKGLALESSLGLRYVHSFSLYKLGLYNQAYTSIKDIQVSSNYYDAFLLLKAELATRLSLFEVAKDLFQEYSLSHAEDIRWRLRFLASLLRVGDYEGAIKEAGKIQNLRSYSNTFEGEITYLTGLAELGNKDFSMALNKFNAYFSIASNDDPYLVYARYYLAYSLFRLERYGEAAQLYAALLKEIPKHAIADSAAYHGAWSYFKNEQYEDSVYLLQRFESRNDTTPGGIKARFLLAQSLTAMESYERARSVYSALASIPEAHSYSDDSFYEYADSFYREGKINEAVAALEEMVAVYPDLPLSEDALFRRGEILFNAGRYKEASDAFYQYRGIYGKGANSRNAKFIDDSLYWGAKSRKEMKDNYAALLLYEKVIDEHPDSPFRGRSMLDTGLIYEALGEPGQAVQFLNRFAASYPDEAKAYNIAEKVSRLNYQLEGADAEESALLVIFNNPGDYDTAYWQTKLIELYIYYINNSLSIYDASLVNVRKNIQGLLFEGWSSDGLTARAYFAEGLYYRRANQQAKAAEQFFQAVRLYPNKGEQTAEALYFGAVAYKKAGQATKSNQLIAVLQKDYPDSSWTELAERELVNE